MTARPLTLPADAVLLRLPVEGQDWPSTLPEVPRGGPVTVTLGHPDLVPSDPGPALARGYHVVGAASEYRPLGSVADLLVTAALREAAPAWWDTLARRASRIFDLRLGPVQQVLSAELALHLEALQR
ncbi:MAG: hypothetical protein R6V28_08210 [Nitriliruptoraceae bacterium]